MPLLVKRVITDFGQEAFEALFASSQMCLHLPKGTTDFDFEKGKETFEALFASSQMCLHLLKGDNRF